MLFILSQITVLNWPTILRSIDIWNKRGSMTVTNSIKSIIFHYFSFRKYLCDSWIDRVTHCSNTSWTQQKTLKKSSTHFVWIIWAFNSVFPLRICYSINFQVVFLFAWWYSISHFHVTRFVFIATRSADVRCKLKNRSYWCLKILFQRKNTNRILFPKLNFVFLWLYFWLNTICNFGKILNLLAMLFIYFQNFGSFSKCFN